MFTWFEVWESLDSCSNIFIVLPSPCWILRLLSTCLIFVFSTRVAILIVYCKFRLIPCRGSEFCWFPLKNGFCSKNTVLIQIPNSIYSAAAAAVKSRQTCPTLCDPIDVSPPGSPITKVLQARTLKWVAISFSSEWKWKVKVKSLSCVRPFTTPWTVAYKASSSMGFPRQEYGSGLPLPSPFTLLLMLLSHFSSVQLCVTP